MLQAKVLAADIAVIGEPSLEIGARWWRPPAGVRTDAVWQYVELRGIEPLASTVRLSRSTN